MSATSFFLTSELIRDDFPTLDLPKTANSGRRSGSLGQSLALALLLTNSTLFTFASPAYGPRTMLDRGSTISVDTSSTATPGGMKRAVLTNGWGRDGGGVAGVVSCAATEHRLWWKEVGRGGKGRIGRRRRSMSRVYRLIGFDLRMEFTEEKQDY